MKELLIKMRIAIGLFILGNHKPKEEFSVDYVDIVHNYGAKNVSAAFGISDERDEEITRLQGLAFEDYLDVMKKNPDSSKKTDLLICASRVGFVAKSPAELAYMTYILSCRIAEAPLHGIMETVKGLIQKAGVDPSSLGIKEGPMELPDYFKVKPKPKGYDDLLGGKSLDEFFGDLQ